MREDKDSTLIEKDKAVQKYQDLLRSPKELVSSHTAFERGRRLNWRVFTMILLASLLHWRPIKLTWGVLRFPWRNASLKETTWPHASPKLRSRLSSTSRTSKGIASHFKKYVTGLGEDFVIDLFDNLPDDEGDGEEVEGHEDDDAGGDHSDEDDDRSD
ncbi:hypothetical protein LIER_03947 [Lithospermum erythrorhizon]|uniref:Uncharacterized protein n=1 Tax=Lithospermum erythrorhizon TaxID=34254 RepID=A0AAV3NZN1_LITER